MRRILVFALAALALLGVVAPGAYAQAPAPTFKITGFIDTLMTYGNNTSLIDGDLHRKDSLWYGRNRGRFDIIGEYGKAKAVLGLELDMVFGQAGSNDSTIVNAGGAATTAVTTHFGTDGSFDINTDSRGIIQIKWLYTEFEAPLIPVPTVVRVGAQPFGSAATYKLAAYANGDFPGVNVVSTITPNLKVVATYVAVEERLEGGSAVPGSPGVPLSQLRGDDWAAIFSAEITPFKGLDIKPMYSYFTASGTTSGSARQSRGGISAGAPFQCAAGNTNCAAAGDWRKGLNEDRHTVGIDARWVMGPFSLAPTVMYQFGNRSLIANGLNAAFTDAGVVAGRKYTADLDAWLIDIRGGFQLGPLLLEGMYMYTTGNRARNTTLGTVRYFQPLTTDTSYGGDFGPQLTSLGVDYLNALMESGVPIAYPGVTIGWDKYGRHQIAARGTYALTPTLSFMGGVAVHFTDTAIQIDATPSSAGLVPIFKGTGPNGDSHYIGTEPFGGITWRFAPGIAWDTAGGYIFAGKALDALTNPAHPRDAKDAYIVTTRIRFSF
ncbi:MAG TPA: hypothetical protein VGT40_04365 [Methylomirabilota bacterium]|jgi:hypothetical protein|nr:hypothetical protein [Methylomirabilota bacterium]